MPSWRRGGIGKRIDTMRHLPDAKVFADPIRVRQIFRNIVTNADRYGGPNLTVRVDLLGDEFALSLIDDGEGSPRPIARSSSPTTGPTRRSAGPGPWAWVSRCRANSPG